MLRSVFAKTLRDQRRSLLVWAVALAALVALYVAVYPSVKGDSSFAKLIDQMPKAYRALFTTGNGADFTSPAGYLNTELLTFMGPLLVLLYAIGAGAGALAGEEDRRTLDLLLANPISRTRLVVEKFAALAAGVAGLMTVLWLALLAEGQLAGMNVSAGNSAAALVHLGLLGTEYGAVALLAGSLTGHLGVARSAAALLAVLAYLLNGLAPLVGWLQPLRKASPFYQYIGHDPLRTGLSGAALAITIASIAALVAAAIVTFTRREVLA
ncbi:MAG TPA: ABC transporter permease subunit [Acidimicrobiales bacterium]|nr:ABC transporter permease subunit [Acidimicrobiales bacterium]